MDLRMTDLERVREWLGPKPAFADAETETMRALRGVVDELTELREATYRLRGLLARVEIELSHPMMDGSHVVRAKAIAEERRRLIKEKP